MGKLAARVGDLHICLRVDPGPKPHIGGPIRPPGKLNVLIGGDPAARVGDLAQCLSPFPDVIKTGSSSVFIGGKAAARMGDSTSHGGGITTGCLTVCIG